MPLRKEAETHSKKLRFAGSGASVSAKKTCKITNRANHCSGTEAIKALKENNASLAAALDESKQNYRDLHKEFVQLQEERQELLERVFSLEYGLCGQQKAVSEQVRPVFKLLSQAEKNLSIARYTLTALLTTKSSSDYHVNPFSPSLSPISITTDSHYTKSQSSTLLTQHQQPSHPIRITKTFPKTPHPILAASTPSPESGDQPDQIAVDLKPRALDFNQDESLCQEADVPLSKSMEPGDLADLKTVSSVNEDHSSNRPQSLDKVYKKASLVPQSSDDDDVVVREYESGQPRRACASSSVLYQQPSSKSKLTVNGKSKVLTQRRSKADSTTHSMIDDLESGKQISYSTRPKRACSAMNMSYQEPSLKSKLCYENTSIVKISESALKSKAKSRSKSALQDVTNKRL